MKEATLIVARPGRLRDALSALLTTIPQLEIVGLADDGFAALTMVTERHPTLILLDSSLPNHEVKTLVSQLKTNWPQTRCLVLVDNSRQQQVAKSAGADEVLLKGYSTASLLTNIEKLLSFA